MATHSGPCYTYALLQVHVNGKPGVGFQVGGRRDSLTRLVYGDNWRVNARPVQLLNYVASFGKGTA